MLTNVKANPPSKILIQAVLCSDIPRISFNFLTYFNATFLTLEVHFELIYRRFAVSLNRRSNLSAVCGFFFQ